MTFANYLNSLSNLLYYVLQLTDAVQNAKIEHFGVFLHPLFYKFVLTALTSTNYFVY